MGFIIRFENNWKLLIVRFSDKFASIRQNTYLCKLITPYNINTTVIQTWN